MNWTKIEGDTKRTYVSRGRDGNGRSVCVYVEHSPLGRWWGGQKTVTPQQYRVIDIPVGSSLVGIICYRETLDAALIAARAWIAGYSVARA